MKEVVRVGEEYKNGMYIGYVDGCGIANRMGGICVLGVK